MGAIDGMGHLAQSGVPRHGLLWKNEQRPRQRITRLLRQRNGVPKRNSANHERSSIGVDYRARSGVGE